MVLTAVLGRKRCLAIILMASIDSFILATSLTITYAESIDYSTLFHWSSSVAFDSPATAVDEDGGRAFLLVDDQLRILDLTIPGTPPQVGALDLPGSLADIAVQGGIAYVVSGGVGLIVVDARTPGSPVVIGGLSDPAQAIQIELNRNRAYILESVNRVRAVDISTPASPGLLGTYSPGWGMATMALHGSLLGIVSSGDEVRLVDFSNPAAPILLSSTGITGDLYGLAMSRDRFYVGYYQHGAPDFSGMKVYDTADPSHPIYAGERDMAPPGRIAVDGDVVYTIGEPITGGGFDIIDASEPWNMTVLQSYYTGADDLTLIAAGGACLVQNSYTGTGRLEVYKGRDLADHVLSEIVVDGFADLDARGTRVYLADPYSRVRIVDATDPANPITSGQVPLSDTPFAVEVSSDGLFVGIWTSLQFGRLTTPDQAQVCVQDPSYYAVSHLALQGTTLHAAPLSGNVYLIDVHDPCTPVPLGMVPTSAETRALAVDGSYMYVAENATLHIVDVSDPQVPVHVASLVVPDVPYVEALAVSGGVALLPLWGGGLWIVDVADPTDPVSMGTLPFPRANGVVMDGDLAYVACSYGEGISLVNVADPAHPYVVGGVYTGLRHGYALGPAYVDLTSTCVAMVDRSQGLFLLPLHADPAAVDDASSVEKHILSVTGNPSAGISALRLELPESAHVRLSIHDMQGREVRVLLDHERLGGTSDIAWDGRDARGRRVPRGVYFGRLSGLDVMHSVRLVRID